jgi:hypothetical protein
MVMLIISQGGVQMTKKDKIQKMLTIGAFRSQLAFGIAVMSIGYNLIPVKGPTWVMWICGIATMLLGIWVISSAKNKSKDN